MKRLCLIPLMIMIVVSLVFGGCAEPATPTEPAAPTEPTPQPPEKMTLVFAGMSPRDDAAIETEAFFQRLEDATNGKVETEFNWGSALGAPPDHYDMVRTGVADAGYIGLPYTPGLFPATSVFEQPIKTTSNEIFTQAMHNYYKKGYLDKDWADVKLISLWNIGPYNFMWAKDKVATLADFEGKKIRSSGATFSKVIEALGAIPVSASAFDAYLMLQKGTVDGEYSPWSMTYTFKTGEVTKYAIETSSLTFTQAVLMNKDTWNRLPEAAKEYIDIGKNADDYGLNVANIFEQINSDSKKAWLELGSGRETLNLPPDDTEKLPEVFAPIWDEWVTQAKAKGVPVDAALKDLQTIFEELGVQKPLVGYQP